MAYNSVSVTKLVHILSVLTEKHHVTMLTGIYSCKGACPQPTSDSDCHQYSITVSILMTMYHVELALTQFTTLERSIIDHHDGHNLCSTFIKVQSTL